MRRPDVAERPALSVLLPRNSSAGVCPAAWARTPAACSAAWPWPPRKATGSRWRSSPAAARRSGRSAGCVRAAAAHVAAAGPVLTRAWDHGFTRASAGFDVVHSVSLASPQLRRPVAGGWSSRSTTWPGAATPKPRRVAGRAGTRRRCGGPAAPTPPGRSLPAGGGRPDGHGHRERGSGGAERRRSSARARSRGRGPSAAVGRRRRSSSRWAPSSPARTWTGGAGLPQVRARCPGRGRSWSSGRRDGP